MSERREEKYLLCYAEYSVIAHRVRGVLTPDPHGRNGSYSICSMYFDDPYDKALDEKENGLAVHTKYRIRTYDGSPSVIKLERKTKRGIVTEKSDSELTSDELESLITGRSLGENSPSFGLASEIRAGAYSPKICVRYDREAYYQPTTGVRVTFDLNVDSLPSDADCLFGKTGTAIPALPRDKVIMEIKYGEKCPSFVRKCCSCDGMQLSVSKYALCRIPISL